MPSNEERLASIETNVSWLVQEWKDAKDVGFPRCATHAQEVQDLGKSITWMRRILTSALIIPGLGWIVTKFTNIS